MSGYKKYWVWLSLVTGAGARLDEIMAAYKSPAEIYEATPEQRIIAGVFTRKQLERLGTVKLSDAENIVSTAEKNGWNIVTPADKEYPAGLRKIPDMPAVLYVDGDISCLRGKVMIGIVGTRKPCSESIAIARRISSDLAKAGAVVVSGGALGIDSAAHEGAMDSGGKTVCVLGCGLGTDYLMSNEAMRRRISRSGAVVSEFPPFTPASRSTFPIRNRIISGMSHGILVVEAGAKSGSLITARCANEQGREVFAIPGSILSTAYSGANNLIKEGAKAATCARDILAPYAVMYPDRLNMNAIDGEMPKIEIKKPGEETKPQRKNASGLDPDLQAVYNLFGEAPMHPDEISAASGMSLQKVISSLMQLEILGFVEQTNGKNYILK